MKKLLLPLGMLMVILACGTTQSPDRQATLQAALYPSPTPDATQTPVLVEVTTVVQITVTTAPTAKPEPTRQIKLCVTADEAVNLRPSPNLLGYPILQLESGVEVNDLGGRFEGFVFVQYQDAQGWVQEDYIGQCK